MAAAAKESANGINFSWSEADPNVAAETVERLAGELELPQPLARLMAARGHLELEMVRSFLSPLEQKIADPLKIPVLRVAAERLQRAISARENVVIYGDFDADGVVSTAMAVDLIKFCGGEVRHFLPNRHTEGYGLTPAAVERCLAEGQPDLLVTVDCGMAATEQLKSLRSQGVDLLITDHHEIAGEFPEGSIVFNPHQEGVPDSMRYLCGAGVAFQLMNALIKARGDQPRERQRLAWWMDAVAVATIADVVPLEGDNRTLVAHGLQLLNRRPRLGLQKLMQRAGVSTREITSYHLGFVIGPRLNAAGRMESAEPAFQLLSTTSPDEAFQLALELDNANSLRKAQEREVLAGADEQIAQWLDHERHGAVVVGGAGWNPGTVGIVAARLMERFARPAAVVVLDDDGGGRGSLRAGAGYNAVAALKECGHLLGRMGGHERAAGFSINPGGFEEFREAFAAACFGQMGAASVKQELKIDGWLESDDLTEELLEGIKRLEPFGEGHATPCWGFRKVALAAPPRIIGSDESHLKLSIKLDDGAALEAVWFKGAEHKATLEGHEGSFDFAGEISENDWQGDSTIQLIVRDARLS